MYYGVLVPVVLPVALVLGLVVVTVHSGSEAGQVKQVSASCVPAGTAVPVVGKTEILWPLGASGQPAALVS